MMNCVVEAIVDKKVNKETSIYSSLLSGRNYLIKWEGYDCSLNTWAPIQHLRSHCPFCLEIREQN